MTYEEILKKAIEKAWDNGYRDELNSSKNGLVYGLTKDHDHPDLYSIIFSHNFAKSFWGTEMKKPFMKIDFGKPYKLPLPKLIIKFRKKTWIPSTDWQYHLQQMVLEKDPIKYLEKFI